MRTLGLNGARRGRRHRTTIPDPGAPRAADLVQRRFSGPTGGRLGRRRHLRGDLGGAPSASPSSSTPRSNAFTERLAAAGAVSSVGTVGDALDNALAESQIALLKTELIRHNGLWKNVDDVERATLEWVDRHNNRRLHTGLPRPHTGRA
jgi:transposase InsO family protein